MSDAGQRIRVADDRHVQLSKYRPHLTVWRIVEDGRDEVWRSGIINRPVKESGAGVIRADSRLDLPARQIEQRTVRFYFLFIDPEILPQIWIARDVAQCGLRVAGKGGRIAEQVEIRHRRGL